MAFGLTLETAQVSSEETEVVQGKDLQTDTVRKGQMSELYTTFHLNMYSFVFGFRLRFCLQNLTSIN